MKIKFYGVRGSKPSPLTPAQVSAKIQTAVGSKVNPADLPFWMRSTYGGNTSCVDVVSHQNERFVFDMGTGISELGNGLMPRVFGNRGIKINFFLSHLHWDHIQGLPFFSPLYLSRFDGIENIFNFFGGDGFKGKVEEVLRGQMDAPVFPVSFEEIKNQTYALDTHNVYRGFERVFDEVLIKAEKLDHPQDTYGYRLEETSGRDTKVFVYSTDHEPRDPQYPHASLIKLWKNADVVVTDCQYTKLQYEGHKDHGNVCRHGWGHSYPEYVAKAAIEAGAKHLVLFHHDPSSSDEKIWQMEIYTQQLITQLGGTTKVTAAYEGMEIEL